MTNEPQDPDESIPDESFADESITEDAADPATPQAEPTSGAALARPKAEVAGRKVKRQRTGPRQFLREVRSELRKVAWPSRRELFSYSLVVLVSVTLITLYITALDQLFGVLIIRMFGA
jgi:preprotein translocase subunit SecE